MKSAYPTALHDRFLILEEWDQCKDHQEVKVLNLDADLVEVKSGIFHPPFWIRCALFVATCIGAGLASGFFALIFFSSFFSGTWGGFVQTSLMGLASFFICRFFIETKNHFRSGIDDALAIIAICYFAAASFLLRDALNLPSFQWYTFLIAGSVLGIFSRYFLDRFMALVSIGLLITGFYLFLALLGATGLLGLPFLVFVLGVVLTTAVVRSRRVQNLYLEEWLDFLLVCGLVLTVFSIQYFPVNLLFLEFFPGNQNMPYSIIFKILSFLIPLLVLAIGIQKKERAALWVGFLGIAFAFHMTLFGLFHLPIWATLLATSGLFLLPGIWLFFKMKKDEWVGFDMNPNAKKHFLQDALSHAIQTATVVNRPQPESGPEFGDGKFGGGGASESF